MLDNNKYECFFYKPKCLNVGSPICFEIIVNLLHLHVMQSQRLKSGEGLEERQVVDAIQVGLAPLEVVEDELLQVGERPGERLEEAVGLV